MDAPTTTAAGWAGWYRRSPRSPWRLWCRAGSEAECEKKLLDTAPAGDKLVRPDDGRDPNQDRR